MSWTISSIDAALYTLASSSSALEWTLITLRSFFRLRSPCVYLRTTWHYLTSLYVMWSAINNTWIYVATLFNEFISVFVICYEWHMNVISHLISLPVPKHFHHIRWTVLTSHVYSLVTWSQTNGSDRQSLNSYWGRQRSNQFWLVYQMVRWSRDQSSVISVFNCTFHKGESAI